MAPEFWQQEELISFADTPEGRTVQLEEKIIEKGFLTRFPGSSLALFLLLSAKGADRESYIVERERLNCLLPGSSKEVQTALDFLEECDLLEYSSVTKKEDGQDQQQAVSGKKRPNCLKINFKPKNIFPGKYRAEAVLEKKEEQCERPDNAGEEPPDVADVSDGELREKLLEFFPGNQGSQAYRQAAEEVERWCKDFPPKLLQELLRRVRKWLGYPQNPHERAHYYLRAIVSDWYEKGIFSREKLKEYDRLYRETRELARIYGFKNYHQLNPVQLETLKGWLTGSRGLSLEIACWAVRQAVRHKRDGSPSLDYIERNYIKPLKQAGVKNIGQAAEILGENDFFQQEGRQTRDHEEKEFCQEWENFFWESPGN